MIPHCCPQCNHVWDVPRAKKGGQVNCPSCGALTQVGGASDSKLFYGLVFGAFALTGVPFGVMAVMGLLQGNLEMAICPGILFAVACIVLVFVLLGS